MYGDFKLLYKNHKELFVYERSYEGQKMLVALNFSETDTALKVKNFDLNKAELILNNYEVSNKNELSFLRPYEARVYLIK